MRYKKTQKICVPNRNENDDDDCDENSNDAADFNDEMTRTTVAIVCDDVDYDVDNDGNNIADKSQKTLY